MFIFLMFMIALGYNYATHSFLGNLTGQYLEKYEPALLAQLHDVMPEPIAEASVWADKVKRTPKYAWSRTLHYIDTMECPFNPGHVVEYCGKKCITSGLVNFTRYRTDESLKFLLHLTQDINQPFHTLGFDRGGNNFKVIRNKNRRNKTTNLHELWDTELPGYYIDKYHPRVTRRVEHTEIKDETEYSRMMIEALTENVAIACRYYNSTGHYIVFEDYFNADVIKQLFDNYLYMIVNTLRYVLNKIEK